MNPHDSIGCPEYRALSRRQFVAAAAIAAAAPAWLPRVSLAASHRSAQRDVCISIFLRGAADGLSLCVPFSEDAYYAARPNVSVPRPDSGSPNRVRDLQVNVQGPNGSVGFGLAPAMLPLLPAFQAGHLLFVHAAGSTDPTRSHFDAQRFMELGKANDVTIATGWLARHLLLTQPMSPSPALRAVDLTSSTSFTLQGAPKGLPIPDLDGMGVQGLPANEARRIATLQSLYASTTDPTKSIGLSTLATIDLLNTIDFSGYIPGGAASYPDTSFGYSLKTSAALIKAQVGVEAIAINLGDWDMHNNQGTTTGTMANLMATLANGLAAFHADMFAGANPTFSLVCLSEFGRRLQENGSLGTDHGHGNAMILMGNAIAGGRVLTSWPGMQPAQLFEGIDLHVTTDYRDILAEIAAMRLGNSNISALFPGYTPTFRGVTH